MTEIKTVDLSFIGSLCEKTLAEVRAMRREMNEVRSLVLQTVDYTRRVERRIEETKDDFHLMVKAEIGGTLAHFETRLDERFDRIEQHVKTQASDMSSD